MDEGREAIFYFPELLEVGEEVGEGGENVCLNARYRGVELLNESRRDDLEIPLLKLRVKGMAKLPYHLDRSVLHFRLAVLQRNHSPFNVNIQLLNVLKRFVELGGSQ